MDASKPELASDSQSALTGKREADRVQLHLVLPYKFEPRDDHRVRAYLEKGYRVVQLQRLSDREAVITLAIPHASPKS